MKTRNHLGMLPVIALALAGFVGWAALFDIDQTVRAQGQLIPGAHTQIIQTLDGGVLSELRVQEGDSVKADQVLAELESDRARAGYDESGVKLAAIRIALLRAQAEAAGHAPSYGKEFADYPDLQAAQLQLYQQRKSGLDQALRALDDSLALANDELHMNEALFATGDTSRLELLRARRQVTEIQARTSELRNKYLQDARQETAKQEEELSSQRYRQIERRNVLEHTVLTAPLAGVVKSLRVNTVGGVLRAGDELMQISPTDGELVLEVRVSPSDIGLLSLGLPATVRLDAFDYTVYGSITGALVYLSSDTLTDQAPNGQSQSYYRARVRLDAQSLQNNPKLRGVSVKPGMTATVDIRIGERSVLAYLIKPIARAFGGAMRER